MNTRSIQVRSYAYVCSICTFPDKMMGDVMNSSASGSFGFSYIFTKEGGWMYGVFVFFGLESNPLSAHCCTVKTPLE